MLSFFEIWKPAEATVTSKGSCLVEQSYWRHRHECFYFQIHRKYNVKRVTSNLRIPYYVKDSFSSDFSGSLRKWVVVIVHFTTLYFLLTQCLDLIWNLSFICRLESSIEDDYLNVLRQNCFREKSYSKHFFSIFVTYVD